MAKNIPAILGGDSTFSNKVPIIKPNYDRYSKEIISQLESIINSNMVSNVNNYVRKFEDKMADYLHVENVIAVNSCTSGMILAFQALDIRNKEVIIPSYSFSATAHMLYWNNCTPIFVDIDEKSWNIDTTKIEDRITDKTAAIMAVHLYGNPAEIDELERIASKYNIELLFDAAHSLGSKYNNKHPSEYGFVHSYSLSPTKLLSTIEGGLITTNNGDLSQELEISRNYGNRSDYSCKLPGLNARMSELYAAVGLSMVDHLDEFIKNRNEFASIYMDELKSIPGVTFQKIKKSNTSVFKDFCIVIDKEVFGLDRDSVSQALFFEGISTRFYFYPPIHKMEAYEKYQKEPLKITEFTSNNVLSLPIHNFMEQGTVSMICKAISEIQCNSEKIKEKLKVR